MFLILKASLSINNQIKKLFKCGLRICETLGSTKEMEIT